MTSFNWLDRKTALFATAVYLGISALVLAIYHDQESRDIYVASIDKRKINSDVSSLQVIQALNENLSKFEFINVASGVLSSSQANGVGYTIQCDDNQCMLELYPHTYEKMHVADDLRRTFLGALQLQFPG